MGEAFPAVIKEPAGGPPRLPEGQRITGYVNADIAQVDLGGGEHGLVQSLAPMAIETSPGGWAPVDLGLSEVEGAFVTANPVVAVRIPRQLAEGVQASATGLSVTPVDANGSVLGGSEGRVDGASVLYANTLTYAPSDVVFGELGEESGMTAFFAGSTLERPVLLRLGRTIGRLRWSDRRLTRLVRAQAAEERAVATLVLPDVCADIAAWKASGYAVLPQSASGFLAHVQAIESLSVVGQSEEFREAVIMRLLRRYETPAERLTARSIGRLEAQIGRRLTTAGANARKKLATAFGVSAL